MDLLESDKTGEPTVVQPMKHRPFLRPFVTSTPLDFERERDFLATEIFPELDSLCQLRASHFLASDLRYDEHDSNAQNGTLLKLHLDMIARSSPFFIGLLGECYGYHRPEESPLLKSRTSPDDENLCWVDKNLLVAASGAYKWILEDAQQYSSLTELELIQACFFSETEYSFLYFRQQDHVDGLFLDLSEEERERELQIYYSESDYASMKARDLKQRIVNRGLSVKYFNSLEQLGEMVLKDWSAVIDLLCPPLIDTCHHISSEFFLESMHSETVASQRKEFVSSYDLENAMADLTHFTASAVCDVGAESADQSHAAGLSYTTRMRRKSRRVLSTYTSILALTGPRGCGKTSLVTRWLEQAHLENEDVTIVSHYVGGSRLSQDICSVIRKLIHRLWLQHEIKLSPGDVSNLDVGGSDYGRLCETFTAAASHRPTVIIIDGVDQLSTSQQFSLAQIKKLEWLPTRIPANVKFILTTSSSDATFVTLRNRADVRLLHCPEMTDPTLRERILNDNLSDYKHTLTENLRREIVKCKHASTPLFLKMVAMEMTSRSVYANAEEKVEHFTEMGTIREFWAEILKRWVMDMSWTIEGVRLPEIVAAQGEFEFVGWVADALRLVAVSKQGLAPDHLFVCLDKLGYHGSSAVTMTDLALLWETGHKAFVIKLGPLIWFQHTQLREMVDYALLGAVAGDNTDKTAASFNTEKRRYHDYLLEYFYNQPAGWDRSEELLFQCEMVADWDCMYDELCDYRVFLSMAAEDDQPSRLALLHRLWDRITPLGYDVIAAYRDVIKCCAEGVSVTKRSKRIPEAILNDDDTFLTEVYRDPGTAEILSASALSRLMYHIALFLWKRGHVTEAKEILIEANDVLSKNYPLPVEAQYRHCQIQETLGRLHSNDAMDVAMENSKEKATECFLWYQKCLSNVDYLLEMTSGSNKLFLELKGRVLHMIGSLYVQSEDISLASQMLSQSENCFDLAGCIVQKSDVYFYLAAIATFSMKVKEAMYYHQKCLKLRHQWMGKHHPSVADVLMEMAKLTASKDNVDGYDPERAELLYRQAVQIREESLSSTHPHTATAVLHLGCLLKENGSLSCKLEARTLLQRALDVYITKYGYNHPECARINSELNDLNVALKLGLYDYGPAKPTDKRHSEFPYSSLSWRDGELNQLDKMYRKRISSAKYHRLESKLKQDDVPKPEIKIEDVSDSRYDDLRPPIPSTRRQIKSASMAERMVREQEKETLFKRVSVNVKMSYPSQDLIVDSAFMSIPKTPAFSEIILIDDDLAPLDGKRSPADMTPYDVTPAGSPRGEYDVTSMKPSSQYLDSYAVPHNRQTYEKQFSRIRTRPTSAPVQLQERFTLLRMREPSPSRPVSTASRVSSGSRTPRVKSAKSYAQHQRTCKLPSSHSSTNGGTVIGPNSDLQSLLGKRRPVHGIGVQHKAAWYHVPGRYPTPQVPVPPARRQLAERAKSVSSGSCTQVARRTSPKSAPVRPNVRPAIIS